MLHRYLYEEYSYLTKNFRKSSRFRLISVKFEPINGVRAEPNGNLTFFRVAYIIKKNLLREPT